MLLMRLLPVVVVVLSSRRLTVLVWSLVKTPATPPDAEFPEELAARARRSGKPGA